MATARRTRLCKWDEVGLRIMRHGDGFGALTDAPFEVDRFLAQPIVARLATEGPVVRPVWYLWEDQIFWVITGTWSRLGRRLREHPAFELVVDSCDLRTGVTHQVIGRGTGNVVDFDVARGRRKLVRYLGEQEESWDPRFRLDPDPAQHGTRWAKLVPHTLWIFDLSFRAAQPRPTSSGRIWRDRPAEQC